MLRLGTGACSAGSGAGPGAGPSISREPSFAQRAAAAGVGVPLQPVRYNPLVETTPEETV